jgi:response regulator NasT
VCAILRSFAGLEVCIEATDGEDAIRKSKVWNPHLVILDVRMPVLDGFATARIIRELQPNVPILMLSMHAASEMMEHARTAGVQGVVTKSEIGDVLLKGVKALLEGGTFFPTDETGTGHLDVRNLPAS